MDPPGHGEPLMRPPICAVCGERFSGGGLVTFRRSAEDEDWHERQREEGFVGHPPDLEWFCDAHVARARALSALTRAEAMRAFLTG